MSHARVLILLDEAHAATRGRSQYRMSGRIVREKIEEARRELLLVMDQLAARQQALRDFDKRMEQRGKDALAARRSARAHAQGEHAPAATPMGGDG